jgi:acetyl esterase/lipase
MRSMVEGACSAGANLTAVAPSTALRAVPLPAIAGQEKNYPRLDLRNYPRTVPSSRIKWRGWCALGSRGRGWRKRCSRLGWVRVGADPHPFFYTGRKLTRPLQHRVGIGVHIGRYGNAVY